MVFSQPVCSKQILNEQQPITKNIFKRRSCFLLINRNDWRAIEAGAHAYAVMMVFIEVSALDYGLETEVSEKMTIPMPVATKGGSIGINPQCSLNHELLGHPSAKN